MPIPGVRLHGRGFVGFGYHTAGEAPHEFEDGVPMIGAPPNPHAAI